MVFDEIDKLVETKQLIKRMVGEQDNLGNPGTSIEPAEEGDSPVGRLLASRKRRVGQNQEASPIEKEFIIFEAKPDVESTVDRLEWWLKHKLKLPVLAKVAQEVLGVPCSSAKSERVCSSAGLVSLLINVAYRH